MNIIYGKEEKNSSTNIMAIDLGINNIVACTNKDNADMMLVSGREAKCKNKYINEKIKYLQQIRMDENKNCEDTKQIKRLKENRKNYMNTYMHKVSRMVIEYAIKNKCSKIIIGDLKGMKQYNKDFEQILLEELVKKIEYKAKQEGIEVVKISEKYTSGVSAIDNEEVKKENYNKEENIEVYL